MARSKNGEAIEAVRRNARAVKALEDFVQDGKKAGELEEWRRGRAILGYIAGRRVVHLAAELDVTHGSVNR